jgi:23S rRNA (guanosine2251-2'-O)-methyltransferase
MNDNDKKRRRPPERHYDPYHRQSPEDGLNQVLSEGVIEGRNAVIEALRAGRTIDKIYLLRGETDKALGHIASKAREKAPLWWKQTDANWTP